MVDIQDGIQAGWYQAITAFPEGLTTVAYRYESGGWFVPDPDFNEASLVGAVLERLIPESAALKGDW